jgi:hypothetical protein
MLKVEKRVVYQAFGLSINSEIPLPELSSLGSEDDSIDIDIDIRIKDLSKLWNELSHQNMTVIKKNLVMFQIPNIAIFFIGEGRNIIVSPMKENQEDVIRLFLLGSCMGAILMQRRIYPLHGSAVAIDGKAYAIIGKSGAGKSTLASAFLNNGFQILTDDVIAVTFFDNDDTPYITPSYPQQKLWQESLNEFGMESSMYRPLFERETKFAIPITTQFYTEPLPLAGIFELVISGDEQTELLRIEKLARLQTLFFHTYRNSLISQMGIMDWHFKISTKIISQIDMFQLRRPNSIFTAHHLVSQVLSNLL